MGIALDSGIAIAPCAFDLLASAVVFCEAPVLKEMYVPRHRLLWSAMD
jgi:hypothetical protein